MGSAVALKALGGSRSDVVFGLATLAIIGTTTGTICISGDASSWTSCCPAPASRGTCPFNDLVCEALERYVSHRRSRIRSDGPNALFLWDQGTRLPAEVARVIMRCGPFR